MRPISKAVSRGLLLIPLLALPPLASLADVVTDWNLKAGEIIAAHQPGHRAARRWRSSRTRSGMSVNLSRSRRAIRR